MCKSKGSRLERLPFYMNRRAITVEKKVVLFVFPTFAEFEVTVATAILKRQYEIVIVSIDRKAVVSEAGWQIQPHCSYRDVPMEEIADDTRGVYFERKRI